MKIFSKLLVASAFVISFAAPVFADQVEGPIQPPNSINAYGQSANYWTDAYAKEAPMKGHKAATAHWGRMDLTTGTDFGAGTFQ